MAGTISTLGVGSGLQLQSILDQLKAGEQAPITKKKADQLVIKDRIAEFDTLNSSLLTMKDKALTLSLNSTYLKRKVSLSDTKPASVTAQDGIDTGSYNLEVTSLAQKSSWKTTAGVATADSYVNSSGSNTLFSYTLGGKTKTLTVASGTTITQFAAAINDDAGNLGVKATVAKDGSGATPYKLLLQSNTLGEAGRISNVTLPTFGFSEEAGAGAALLDAQVKLGGVTYTRDSNTLTDVVPGLTIKLQATGQTNIDVSSDPGDVGTNIKDFVTNLVKFLNSVDENNKYDKNTKTGGSLFGLSSFSSFKSQLVNQVFSSIDNKGSKIKSMVDLGLSIDRSGTISLDEKTLTAAIANNFNDVQKMMVGDTDKKITGWADTINESLRYATKTTTGMIATEKSAAQTQLSRLDTQIAMAQDQLDKRYEIMTKQFQALDKFSSSMNNMSSYLTRQFDALSSSSSSSK